MRVLPRLASAFATVVVGFAASAVIAQDAGAPAKVEEILTRMDREGFATVWDRAVDLENVGAEGAPILAKKLDGANATVKVGIAKALFAMEGADAQRGAAISAIKDVLQGDGTREVKVAAAELLSLYAHKDELKPLERAIDGITDPYVKLAVLKALRKRAKTKNALDQMKAFLTSDDFSVRAEAALRLGECDEFEASKATLAMLKLEPSDRGRRARDLLLQAELLEAASKTGGLTDKDEIVKLRDKQIERLKEQLREAQDAAAKGTGGFPGANVIKEIEEKISRFYIDEKKAKTDFLTDAAAQGIADALDPFSQYMTEKQNSAFKEGIGQEYAGIGAVVQSDRHTGLLTIVRPIYGGPAYRAGLRTLDQILEVEGKSTKGIPVNQLVTRLKGKRGSNVKILVKRFLDGPEGAAKELEITRDAITLSSVRFDLLAGKIGYLQLEQFGAKASDEVEAALTELEKLGMRALIFDLRGNPGGYLNQAVEVASKFLAKGQLVVYQKGRTGSEIGARRDFRVQGDETHPDYPLAVLVDENSASASEIVSGALQVHKRADLVGQQTFGKGSVQQVFPLMATDGKSALRITIAYYYLPDDRCIHRPRSVKLWRFREMIRSEIERWKQEGQISDAQAKILLDQYKQAPGGVVPDFVVEAQTYAPDVQKKMAAVLDSGKLEAYIQKHWKEHQKPLHDLARWDSFQVEKYPDFESFYSDLKTELSKDDVRKLLRMEVRRFTQDDLAKILPSDVQEDLQLQAGVWVLCKKMGQDVTAIPELAYIAKKFPSGIERNAQVMTGKKGPPDSPEDDDSDELETPKPEKKDEKKPEKKAPEKKDEKKPDTKKEDF